MSDYGIPVGNQSVKARTLILLAGLGSPLIVAGLASGAFVGVAIEGAPNQYGILTVQIYALFDNLEQDHLLSVTGTPDLPLHIRVYGGNFYQHQFNFGDTAPREDLVVIFPSLAFDTFVSIGRLTQTISDPDTTQLSKGWPGFADCSLIGSGLSWSVPADDPQGVPDRDGRVFIGQFSTANSHHLGGLLLIKAISDGDPDFQAYITTCQLAPCPRADVDGNGCVGIEDFLLLLGLWGSSTCSADLDGDGVVGITDFLIVLGNWTTNCR